MTIPAFVNLEHDEATRKAYVTVEDREVKKQREMWGMASAFSKWDNVLILHRDYSRIPTKSHPRGIRRPYSYFKISGSWISSHG
jgi:hypothetical protein